MTPNETASPRCNESDYFRHLCRNAAMAIVATDAQFNIVCWNEAAEKLTHIAAAEMLGKPLADAVPPERRKLLDRLLQRTAQKRLNSQFDMRMAGADDEPDKYLMIILSPILDDEDNILGISAWLVDETHRKRLTEQLAQAEKTASLGTLAGGVAHHFNNIFGGVATFVDYALTSGDIVAMKRALQMTTEAAARASKITQSLLSFAEQDSHRTDLADLTEVVLTFAHLVERPLAEKNIQLELNLKPVPIIAVEANRMHQVLGNMLTNAEEAMGEKGGKITIRLDRTKTKVTLAFSDTGCGIDSKHLPFVFEPFFTTKGLLAGGDHANPGLGLSVVHGIIMEMGGKISVESEPGKGATFLISFPLARKNKD